MTMLRIDRLQAPFVLTAWMVLLAFYALPAAAGNLPGAADSGRIDQRGFIEAPPPVLEPAQPLRGLPSQRAPEASRALTMHLNAVRIIGMHAFTTAQIADVYEADLDRDITMDTAWRIAGQLTERYHAAGYFLSRAVVPQQEIDHGVLTIRIIEGYIGEVKFNDPLAQQSIVKDWIARLQSYRPLKAQQLEAVLLQLNDLPGVSLHAVLEPVDKTGDSDGAVRLLLEPRKEKQVNGQLRFDNSGSRYLGPYELMAQASATVVPLQRTTLTWLSSMPWDELKYGGVKHEISLFPGANLELYGTRTHGVPGDKLTSSDIRSDSTLLGLGLDYTFIRQRQENLFGRFAFESRDTDADIVGTPLTRDAIRALRAGLTYQLADGWGGNNTLSATVSQGLGILGASKAGDANLSRAEAKPDFTVLTTHISRTQALGSSWGIVTEGAAQIASGPLYSSEEFGYGGQAFGRAYDDSEITGDHGVAGSIEMRYFGLPTWQGMQTVPYGFYDIGMVWNEDAGQPAYAMGSSAGGGIKLVSDLGLAADLGLAFPISRHIANPISGNGSNPRFLLQISYGF